MSRNKFPLLVLCGGFGTRLQPSIGSYLPKVLAPIGKTDLLTIQVENWISQGINSFIFLLHYRAELIKKKLEMISLKNKSVKIEWVEEKEPLGTGGAVLNAIKRHSCISQFFVINADTWLPSSFQLFDGIRENTLLCGRVKVNSRFGSVISDNSNNVIGFSEKDSFEKESLVYVGLCFLNREAFEKVQKKSFSLEHIIFPALASTKKLKMNVYNDIFIDIGIPTDYDHFVNSYLKGKL